jgi:hypothetical protein
MGCKPMRTLRAILQAAGVLDRVSVKVMQQ